MHHKLLLGLLLLSISATHGMETVENTPKHETIYSLFINNQHAEAKKIMPHSQHALTPLFMHGIEQNNASFIQWLLDTKKPLFDEHCVQESYKSSSNPEITLLLVNYITAEKDKRQQELHVYAQRQATNIAKHKVTKNNQPECTCIIS